MKNKIITLIMFVVFLSSCSLGIKPYDVDKEKKNKGSAKSETSFFDKFSLSLKKSDKNINNDTLVDGYVIVKTAADFDDQLFEANGFNIEGKIPSYDKQETYWYINIGKNKLQAVKNIQGVISAEYDRYLPLPSYTVGQKEQQDLPIGIDTNVDILGLDESNYDDDPIAKNADYGLKITKALDAYKEVGYGDNQVVVGILDTGTNMEHKDFWFKNSEGKDECVVLYAKTAQKRPGSFFPGVVQEGEPFTEIKIGKNLDRAEHGTHCSGTICARGNNGIGIAGVAWKNTKLISYQVLGFRGVTTWAIYGSLLDLTNTVRVLRKAKAERSTEDIALLPSYLKDTEFQITQKTVPVNMSLGGPIGSEFEFYVMHKALEENVLPVIAMGNEGRYTASYPAAFPGVISVGATTGEDKKAGFSTSGAWISITAPGDGVKSCGTPGEDTYQTMSGTSMATPFITGVLGYLLSFDNARNLTPYQLKSLLEDTADKIDGSTDFNDRYGYGRVNVLEAAIKVRDNNIPSSKYSEASVKIYTEHKDKALKLPITLVDNHTNAVLALTEPYKKDYIEFKGLVKNRSYSVYTSFAGNLEKKDFTVSDTEQEVNFKFTDEVIWVSTLANKAYNNGEDTTDTQIFVFEANDKGMPTNNKVLEYDHDQLDTAYFVPKPNKAYYVAITGFVNPKTGDFFGGNYVVNIDDDRLDSDSVTLLDPPRPIDKADENDSHEDDGDPILARLKGSAWKKQYACNLVALKQNNETIPDVDIFVISKATNALEKLNEKPALQAEKEGLKVTWKPVSNAAANYLICIYENNVLHGYKIAEKNKTDIVIPGLDSTKTYSATVTALGNLTEYKDSEESEKSDGINPFPSVPKVTEVKAESSESGKITVTWTCPPDASNIEKYKVTLLDNKKSAVQDNITTNNATAEYTFTGISAGNYFVMVTSLANENLQNSQTAPVEVEVK